MPYLVRVILNEQPILQEGRTQIMGEKVETIEAQYADLASAVASVSPKYINEAGVYEYSDRLFSAVITGGLAKKLHCYVPMIDEGYYVSAVKSGEIHPNVLEIAITERDNE